MSSNFRPGQRVRLTTNGNLAYIRFVGETDFKEGEWVGLELDKPVGKNNGSVGGREYFRCPELHGMFMRPLPSIEVLEQPKPQARPLPRTTAQSRTSTAHAGPAAAQARQSMGAPPARRTSTAPHANSTTSNATSRRTSVVPAAASTSSTSRTSRLSLASRSTSPRKSTIASPQPPSPRKASVPSLPASRPGVAASTRLGVRSPPGPVRSPPPLSSSSNIDRALSPRAPAVEGGSRVERNVSKFSAPAGRAPVQHNKVVDELQTKVQFLEKKRRDDLDKLRGLEELKEKAERYEAIIQKLQTKCQTNFQETNDLKKHAAALEEKVEKLETIQAEHDSVVELATLDREMAEERAESYRTELDSLKNRMEELDLENEILKEENEELGKEMSPEERASQGWLQMQRENERLRDALFRLRDWTQEQETQLREEIKSLEEDTRDMSQIRMEFDNAKARLLECEAEIDDLREQLEAALGAETMIEQLTEKNLGLSDRIDDLRKTVEHLQDLKELSDEVELNHVENEKQMQEVIDFKDTIITEQNRRTARQDDELAEKEYTISRFRELVTNMQSDLEEMRASKQISEMEAQNLENSSRAIMDLNRQLQASANTTTIKTIDIELRRMEAEEASEHLSIVQLFLPDTFHSERDSVLTLLRFKRIGLKARLLHTFIKQRLGAAMETNGENVFIGCEASDKLCWIFSMTDRFVAALRGSSLEDFAKFDDTLYELEPVERSLNGYIENLRKDELRESEVVEGLQRSIAVMNHLAELHIKESLESYAEEVLMKSNLMQTNLENAAIALIALKSTISSHVLSSEDDDMSVLFDQKVDSVISDARTGKVVASKICRALQEMKSRHLSLSPETLPRFTKCADLCSELYHISISLGNAVASQVHASDGSHAIPLPLFRTIAAMNFQGSNDVFTPMRTNVRTLLDKLADLHTSATDLSQMAEFEAPPPPWVLRSRELQDRKQTSLRAEDEIKNLKRDAQERATALKLRDQSLEEAKMRIELLESRAKEAGKRLERLEVVEKNVLAAKEKERTLEKAVEEHLARMEELETERDSWMRLARESSNAQTAPTGGAGPGKTAGEVNGVLRSGGTGHAGVLGPSMFVQSVDAQGLREEIAALQKTVRFLRRAARRAEEEEMHRKEAWLAAPLMARRNEAPPASGGVGKTREECREVLRNVAALPSSVGVLADSTWSWGLTGDGKAGEKESEAGRKVRGWRPMKESPRWKLCEEETRWLRAWEPLGVVKMGGKAALAMVEAVG